MMNPINLSGKSGKFLRVICPKCKKKQTIFGKSSLCIKCECGHMLNFSRGGKSKIKAIIKEVVNGN